MASIAKHCCPYCKNRYKGPCAVSGHLAYGVEARVVGANGEYFALGFECRSADGKHIMNNWAFSHC
jgi:hypothetical protein